MTTAEDGSLIVVASDPALPVDVLVDVAEGIEPVDDATWDRQVDRAEAGGPSD